MHARSGVRPKAARFFASIRAQPNKRVKPSAGGTTPVQLTATAPQLISHNRTRAPAAAHPAVAASACVRNRDEAWSHTLVVVEGLSDQRAVLRAVPAQVFVLHGASKSSTAATAQLLKQASEACSPLIALLDPDVAGRQSRTVVDACLPGKCLHAFIPVWQATAPQAVRQKLAGDIGVEHASPSQIRQALIEARPSCPGRSEFTRADLVQWGLVAEMGTKAAFQSGCAQRREIFSAVLGLGHCDGKQLLRQLNTYGFTQQHVAAALVVVNA